MKNMRKQFSRTTVNIAGTVCRRQILTSTDGPRAERIKTFIMAVDPQHRYTNESEGAN